MGFIWYTLILGLSLGIGSLVFLVTSSGVLKELIKQRFTAKPPASVFERQSINILMLGCDENLVMGGGKILDDRARSDLMLLMRLDFKNREIGAVSIPRDTLVKLKGYKRQKINAYHTLGGDELSQRAVESLLRVKIDRTFSLDYQAFQDLVNAVGGVPVSVDKDMDYDDNVGNLHIHLKKGDQVLDGYKSMGFVRFRHADSDLYRQARQQQFMLAFKSRLMSRPFAIGAVADGAKNMARGAFTDEEVASLVNFAQGVPKSSIKMGTIPVVDGPNYTLRVDKKRMNSVLKSLKITDDEPDQDYSRE